jgi:Trk-type K+ transport system membrane component
MVFMFSFALLISAGMLLLKTPRATPEGIGWVDALFTATSAVCVTGLSSLDTSTAFTRHGQWVILGLVQLGGLGVMTFTYFFAYFLAGGVSLRNRIALRDLLSEDTLGKLGVVLGSIIGFTFTCEAVGAVAIHALLDVAPDAMPADERVFFSLFHSITAFCSAGFSTLKGGLADPSLAGCGGVLGVVMVLVVAGGIGFPVMQNCWQTLLGKIGRKIGLRPSVPPRFSTNTRIVFVTTLVLFVGGTLGIYATEFWAGGVGAEGSVHPRWFVAMFNAVAARTAGFSISTDVFTPATTIIIMFLMFVGGGPSSTAGGIKTTTLAVSVLSLRRVLLGRADIEAFGRRLDDSIANRALATVFAAFGFVMLVTVSLCLLHPELPAMDLTFEAVSAVSTAGLSRNVTASLSDGAKLVLVFAMFFGRVGVLTCLLALIPRREPTGYRLPEGDVTIN